MSEQRGNDPRLVEEGDGRWGVYTHDRKHGVIVRVDSGFSQDPSAHGGVHDDIGTLACLIVRGIAR